MKILNKKIYPQFAIEFTCVVLAIIFAVSASFMGNHKLWMTISIPIAYLAILYILVTVEAWFEQTLTQRYKKKIKGLNHLSDSIKNDLIRKYYKKLDKRFQWILNTSLRVFIIVLYGATIYVYYQFEAMFI